MNYFIKNIKVNKLFHLNNFDIPISDKKCPHLIITGKNGSGKTVLLNAIADFLEKAASNPLILNSVFTKKIIESLCQTVEIEFGDLERIIKRYQNNDFLLIFYQADRKSEMLEAKNPTKPIYSKKGKIKKTATDQFLFFLSDLKIQEALARNEGQLADADDIRTWFIDFEGLLKQIYQDDNLQLEFNYKDYSFKINTDGKSFKFTEMSDGFAAVLDIVADLILKMQGDNSLSHVYQKQGIVLIDEIETHLHLELQRIIMPILTGIFPNIQFIITTHSPFVLSSMNNAVAFDLEHREVISELTEYSYEALAEGYFGVKTESSYMEMQLNTLQRLLVKEEMSDSDKVAVRQLICDFDKIPESVSPLLVGRYLQLKIENMDKIEGVQ